MAVSASPHSRRAPGVSRTRRSSRSSLTAPERSSDQLCRAAWRAAQTNRAPGAQAGRYFKYPAPPKRPAMKLPTNGDARRAHFEIVLARVPDKPGVYKFKDAHGRLLYVGVAESLRSRVRSY